MRMLEMLCIKLMNLHYGMNVFTIYISHYIIHYVCIG